MGGKGGSGAKSSKTKAEPKSKNGNKPGPRAATPEKKTEKKPSVTITTPKGAPVDSVVIDQPFVITVTVPFDKNKTQGLTTEVTVKTAIDAETVTLARDPDAVNTPGWVIYKSNPVTLKGGGAGGGTGSLPGLDFDVNQPLLEWSTGDLGKVSVDNGGTVTFSGEGAQTDIKSYDTVRKQTVAQQEDFFTAAGAAARQTAIALKNAPDVPAVRQAKLWANQVIKLVEHAYRHINKEGNSDVERINYGLVYIDLIRQAGYLSDQDMNIAESTAIWNAGHNIKQDYYNALWVFQKEFAIGMYQLTISQCPFVESAFMLLTGNNILGQKLEGWEIVVAGLGLAQELLMFSASIKFSLDYNVGRTTPKIQRDYAIVAPKGVDLTKAPPGTLVRTPEDFGMLGTQAREINRVLSVKADEWGHPVFAKFRSSGPGALEHLADGLPGKPEPIKGKSINKVDIEAGYAKATDGAGKPTQNTIGYFTPEQISDAIGVPLDKFPQRIQNADGTFTWGKTPPPPDGVPPQVWERSVQRVKEYFHEGPMMNEIFGKGLAKVNEYGQIVDYGITAYKLDEHHNIVPRGHGNPEGTKTAIASDPDPYIFTDGNGVPLPPSKTTELVDALSSAGVMHGAVAEWFPHEVKNQMIQKAIMGKHGAKIKVTKGEEGLSATTIAPDEALIVFGGYGSPTKVGWGNVPTSGLSKPTPTGPSLGPKGKSGPNVAGKSVRAQEWLVPPGYNHEVAIWDEAKQGFIVYGPGTLKPPVETVDPATAGEAPGQPTVEFDDGNAFDAIVQSAAREWGAAPEEQRQAVDSPDGLGWLQKLGTGFSAAALAGGLFVGGTMGFATTSQQQQVEPPKNSIVWQGIPFEPPSSVARPVIRPGKTRLGFASNPVILSVNVAAGASCGSTFSDQWPVRVDGGTMVIQTTGGGIFHGPLRADGTLTLRNSKGFFEGRIEGTEFIAAHVYQGCQHHVTGTLASPLTDIPIVDGPDEPRAAEPKTDLVNGIVNDTPIAPSADGGLNPLPLAGGLLLAGAGTAGLIAGNRSRTRSGPEPGAGVDGP